MKFFKVIMSMGHQGSGREKELILAIQAENAVGACMKARQFPAAKHKKIPSMTKEITREEYIELRKLSAYDR